jgi:hypothetical protein
MTPVLINGITQRGTRFSALTTRGFDAMAVSVSIKLKLTFKAKSLSLQTSCTSLRALRLCGEHSPAKTQSRKEE